MDTTGNSGEDFVTRYELPKNEWEGMWESIYVDDIIKRKIINFGLLEHRLSQIGFNKRSLSHHGAILLSGPPGTGKTTLAKGAANQLSQALDMETVYKEINVQRLFSSGFGDTPTLVDEAFNDGVIEPAKVGEVFQVLLLDEVESVFSSRDMLGTNDPFDAIRAVNEALRQLDRIAEVNDVFVIATSNQPSGIDRAFYDRTDEQLFIGNPKKEHRARIFEEIFTEFNSTFKSDLPTNGASMGDLLQVSDGFSGRRIRKTVLSALTRDSDTIKNPSNIEYDQIVEEFIEKREKLERGDRDYVELGVDPDDFEDRDVVEQGSETEDEPTAKASKDKTQKMTGKKDKPKDNRNPSSAQSADLGSNDNTPSESGENSSKAKSGSLDPRTVVLDRTKQNPHEHFRNTLVDFFGKLLEETEVKRGDLESVLLSDELEKMWYRLCMTRDLQRVQLSLKDLNIPVDVSYDQGSENRLNIPSPDVFSGSHFDGPARITIFAKEGTGKDFTINANKDDIVIEMEAISGEGGF